MYRDLDRPYVAQQLNGPIITAFIKAVYNFFHKDVDDKTDYFNSLSIETADTEHLLLIGKLMGLQLFTIFADAGNNKYLTFATDAYSTEDLEYNNGWAEEYLEGSDDVKGVFGSGAEQIYPIKLSDAQYAKLLSALADTPSASVDSLFVVDTLLNTVVEDGMYNIERSEDYPDMLNVTLGSSVPLQLVNVLQNAFDTLLKGGTTVVVTRSL